MAGREGVAKSEGVTPMHLIFQDFDDVGDSLANVDDRLADVEDILLNVEDILLNVEDNFLDVEDKIGGLSRIVSAIGDIARKF